MAPFFSAVSMVDSPRCSALGGASSAIGADPTLAWINPSSVAGVTVPSLVFGGQRGFIGDVSWSTVGVFPVGDGGGVAAGIAWYDAGSVTLHPAGAPARSVGVQEDLLGMVTAGGGAGGVRAGFSLKLLNSTLLEEYSANAAALDAGISVDIGGGFTAGVLARNLSGGIRFEKEEIPLPSTLQGGLSGLWENGADRAGIFADGIWDLERGKPGWGGGMEYRWSGSLSVRLGAGRRPDGPGTGFTMGFGFAGPRYRLDYATRLEVSETAPQVLCLTLVP